MSVDAICHLPAELYETLFESLAGDVVLGRENISEIASSFRKPGDVSDHSRAIMFATRVTKLESAKEGKPRPLRVVDMVSVSEALDCDGGLTEAERAKLARHFDARIEEHLNKGALDAVEFHGTQVVRTHLEGDELRQVVETEFWHAEPPDDGRAAYQKMNEMSILD
jgi:hypothetical protein